ncbi:Regulator of nonsense transcripts 1 [Seminavis robusta]|uniref:Regulator of nonsense transcripts 1 n=1 Tax=Seminavis robusta TaxID=568900 RepID=A0A9N8EMM9_9STRA|nr:Regulator of nonsense transcripts 1 [Seminavis robusta]|eukprot:Sro1270_g257910.1 Regulator of nonsense transcripts 1 (612) ;mRNA; f:3029-5098
MVETLSGKDPQKTKRRKQTTGVSIRVNSMDDEFAEIWTYDPLPNNKRNSLRSGTVVAMVPSKRSDDPTVRLGVLQFGSRGSQVLPDSMQDDADPKKITRDTGDGANQNQIRRGDRMTCFLYGACNDGDDLEMQPLVSILNYQRQFTACRQGGDSSDFDGALFGRFNHETECSPPSEDLNDTAIVVPSLNQSQQLAADDFIFARDKRIMIAQGPPGTGKTTMLVATICRYIMHSKQSLSKRKLLVCGPTNKSVTVLARKVLKCIQRDETIHAALIGDKEELLQDDREGLEDIFVYSYMDKRKKRWKRISNAFVGTNDFSKFERDSENMLRRLRRQIPNVSLSRLEMALSDVGDTFENCMAEEDTDLREQSLRFVGDSLLRVTRSLQAIDEQEVHLGLLNSADVIFCTLSTCGSKPMRRMNRASDLIIDEASAATEAEVLIPLHTKPDKLFLVGDPKQLPATVLSPLAQKCGLARSLQERLMFKNKMKYTLLDVQYRMRPEISKFPVCQFYEAKVRDGSNVVAETYASDIVAFDGDPLTWVQLVGEETKDGNMSTLNESEARAVVATLIKLKEKNQLPNSWFSADRIRIITFYKAQAEYISSLLKKYQIDVLV